MCMCSWLGSEVTVRQISQLALTILAVDIYPQLQKNKKEKEKEKKKLWRAASNNKPPLPPLHLQPPASIFFQAIANLAWGQKIPC